MNKLVWPPNYIIKKDTRAKTVKLRIKDFHLLSITIPRKFNIKNIPLMLETHKDWIEHQFKRQQPIIKTIPTNISLPYTNEIWCVEFNAIHKRIIIKEEEKIIVLANSVYEFDVQRALIISWLKEYAKRKLLPDLLHLSHYHQLPIQTACIRDQHTRWGSCSIQKKISLNYKLLFLPAELSKHVMLHELAHTRYLNHSMQFWQFLGMLDENSVEHNRKLRKADSLLPAWIK